ncbi:hypothetical protein JOM56_013127 [Amanita muscaria]
MCRQLNVPTLTRMDVPVQSTTLILLLLHTNLLQIYDAPGHPHPGHDRLMGSGVAEGGLENSGRWLWARRRCGMEVIPRYRCYGASGRRDLYITAVMHQLTGSSAGEWPVLVLLQLNNVSFHSLRLAPKRAVGALALLAVAAERALTLWADGHFRILPSGESELIEQLNANSGKMSKSIHNFRGHKWSQRTAVYVNIVQGFPHERYQRIVAQAQLLAVPNSRVQDSGNATSLNYVQGAEEFFLDYDL